MFTKLLEIFNSFKLFIAAIIGTAILFAVLGYTLAYNQCQKSKIKIVQKAAEDYAILVEKNKRLENAEIALILEKSQQRIDAYEALQKALKTEPASCTATANPCRVRALEAAATGDFAKSKRVLEECKAGTVPRK